MTHLAWLTLGLMGVQVSHGETQQNYYLTRSSEPFAASVHTAKTAMLCASSNGRTRRRRPRWPRCRTRRHHSEGKLASRL